MTLERDSGFSGEGKWRLWVREGGKGGFDQKVFSSDAYEPIDALEEFLEARGSFTKDTYIQPGWEVAVVRGYNMYLYKIKPSEGLTYERI